MINKQDVKHAAKLARLSLSEKEAEKMENELSSILGYIEKLKEVEIDGVKPTSHPINIENIMREDEEKKERAENEKLLDLAPETKDNYLKVKSILKYISRAGLSDPRPATKGGTPLESSFSGKPSRPKGRGFPEKLK